MKNLSNFALFQVVWFACVLGAARGNGWIGPLAAASFVAFELARSRERARELGFVVAAGLAGALVDSALQGLGLIAYARAGCVLPTWLVPGWVFALWIAFATLPLRSLSWLAGRPLLAFALGAAGGPLSFLAGVRLGATTLPAGDLAGLAALALEWAVATPLLLHCARWAERTPARRAAAGLAPTSSASSGTRPS